MTIQDRARRAAEAVVYEFVESPKPRHTDIAEVIIANEFADLAREVERLGRWQCSSCGCRFNSPEHDQVPDLAGVKKCSKCVEADMLARERDELRRLLELALPSVKGDAQMYSDLGRFHPLPAEHDQEIANAEAAKWLLVEQIDAAIGKEPSND